MKILICPDKFKESLTATEVAAHIKAGISKAMPDAECKILPMADGGEGTAEALILATNGYKEKVKVMDPLLRPVDSFIGISGDGDTAFIEMAAASGLTLLKPEERNPLKTTSYGTGELIRYALDKGCKRIIIGIGGSATVDGGVGMAQSLGVKFTDEWDRTIEKENLNLAKIKKIDISQLDPRIRQSKIQVASDVRNVLTGPEGAARVFGPQKGADEYAVVTLERNLEHMTALILHQLHINVADMSGGGAAGGMGAGIFAFLGGEVVNGFELVAEVTGLEQMIKWADLVVTGEGKIDNQTAFGKTPAGVAKMASRSGKPVIGFAGMLDKGYESLYKTGFTALIPIADKPMSLRQSLAEAGDLLENAAERIFRLISAYATF